LIQEAEAISTAFFGPDNRSPDQDDLLYVGSVKTVIGHTEGTAGIAGLLKASLAVQHGIIPPNLLFNTLSPAVEPFYSNLEIATTAKPWPEVSKGRPRRASVNSFGFGGTNAHVIVENLSLPEAERDLSATQYTPFIFSAASEQALKAMLASYTTYLQANPDLNLQDLSYTLYARRSALPVRVAFSASSSEALVSEIEKCLEAAKNNENQAAGVGVRPLTAAPSVLGVFTGQGAQWATMGRQLLLKSQHVRKFVEDLDSMLQTLPEAHRPSWSFVDEMLAESSSSRLGEAIIAQPLCTVVQIILVDLLNSAGFKFKAVVGHSSGEIAAAYAAGLISRYDAVRIAYYRGLFTTLAGHDQQGAMMAVGTSMDDATEVCNLPMFEGRLCVAANNSSSSVTMSGDLDAIEEAKVIFEEEKKFARILKVDKAYHSWHMIPCSAAYVKALQDCKVESRQPENGCSWFSSTYENTKMESNDELSGTYWKNNMVRPVLFSQAIEAATAQEGPFNIGIEIGPHPTLKGPVLQSLQDIGGQSISYTGLLSRGMDDVEAFSEALGFIWTQFSSSLVDLGGYDSLVSSGEKRLLMKSLPTYHWDHDKVFWHDSRASRAFRTRKHPPHPLLGSRVNDEMDGEMRWRNLLRPSELPWIHGHQLQGQMVFPAVAYVATAVEASKFLAGSHPIGLLEICDFQLGKPLTFDDDESGVEIVFSFSDISRDNTKVVSAAFTYHACTNQESDSLTTLATGRVLVGIGEPSSDWLPSRSIEPPNMVSVNEDQFYSSLDTLGYEYSGSFRSLSSMQRKLNFGLADVTVPLEDDSDESLLIHPGLLDSGLQAIFLAYWWPNDGSLEQLHVPTEIHRILINVPLCQQDLIPGTRLPLSSHLTENPLTTSTIRGDVDIFGADGHSTLIQIEGVKVVPFSEPTPDSDRQMFSEHVWSVLSPDCELAMGDDRASADDYELATIMERVAIYYLKQLDLTITNEERESLNLEWHHQCLFTFASHIISQVHGGKLPFAETEWLNDTWEDIAAGKAK
jgi:hybrid polyketide synthase / nonribosomal peptide synthetase ACE1